MYSDNENEEELSYASGTQTTLGLSFEKGDVRRFIFHFLLQQHPSN